MTDPLAEVVGLLKPAAGLAKVVGGAGRWRLRRTDDRQPFYCVVLEGACRLAVAGDEAFTLAPGDFVLIPAADDYTVSSVEPTAPGRYTEPVTLARGEVRLGAPVAYVSGLEAAEWTRRLEQEMRRLLEAG